MKAFVLLRVDGGGRLAARRKSRSESSLAGTSALLGLTLAAADIARRTYRRSQLFCPEREPVRSWNPADYHVPPSAAEEVTFETPDGEVLYGWYCRAPEPVASALFCHGNSGNLTTVAEMIQHHLRAGLNVLFFDYRGYGRSSGTPSIAGVLRDAATAARFHDSLRPAGLPSVLYGFSLGGAIAAQLLTRHRFDGLVLQSTFTSLSAVTRLLFPRLPMHLLAGNLFDTIASIRRLEIPLLVLHGLDDEVIPASMGRQLYDACSSRKMLHEVRGGLHKDLFVRDSTRLVEVLSAFIRTLDPTISSIADSAPATSGDLFDNTIRFVRRHLRRQPPFTPKTL